MARVMNRDLHHGQTRDRNIHRPAVPLPLKLAKHNDRRSGGDHAKNHRFDASHDGDEGCVRKNR